MSAAADVEVAVIGAGITGLELGRLLAERGVEHVILESAAEPGGVIRTRTIGGRIVEEGPQRTRLTPAIRSLIDALGIHDQVVTAPPALRLFIYARGRLRRAPLSVAQLLTTDLFSMRARLRVLMEPMTAPPRPDESVAECLVRRFGEDAYHDLIGPLFGGLYAGDPADMPARHTLVPTLREMRAERSAVRALVRRRGAGAPPLGFRGGMRVLTDALFAGNRANIRLATPARRIVQDRDGYAIETDHEPLRARHVVITVPAGEAARLLHAAAPASATVLARLRYNPVVIVHLDAEPRLHGLGYQVSFRERLETRGVTFNHALFGRDRLYTAFLGGARDPSAVDQPDDRLAHIAIAEFETVTRLRSTAINVARAWIPAWDRGWDALASIHLPPGLHLAANYESRIGLPGRLARARELAGALSPP